MALTLGANWQVVAMPSDMSLQNARTKAESAINDSSGENKRSMSLFEIKTITLNENFTQTILVADGTCSVNKFSPSPMPDLNDSWKKLNEYADITQMSDLAILEQVKREIQKTKLVMPIDQNIKTRLQIHYQNGREQNLSLVSADTMFQAYPNARMLALFMHVVMEMRDVQTLCSKPRDVIE